MNRIIRGAAGAFSAATLVFGASLVGASGTSAQSLKVETGNSAGMTTLLPQLLAKSMAKQGVDFQINSDQTLTRTALSLGVGRIDIGIVPPPAYNAMKRAVGPYKKAGEQAKKAAAGIRSLFPFAGGVF